MLDRNSLLATCLRFSILSGLAALGAAQVTVRVGVGSGGVEGNGLGGYTEAPISDDGRWVAFDTRASNFAPNDTPSSEDVFLHDRFTGETLCASLTPGGFAGGGRSYAPSLTGDGRYLAFMSTAILLAEDFDTLYDIYVLDRDLGTLVLASLDSQGVKGFDDSWDPNIAHDGRYVSFYSFAANLVPNDTNGFIDVFVRDLQLGTLERVSVSTAGVEANHASESGHLSVDGRFVLFDSFASNLVAGDTNGLRDCFLRDRLNGTTVRITETLGGGQATHHNFGYGVSADGRNACFGSQSQIYSPLDTNLAGDVFVRDMQTGLFELISVGPNGEIGDGGSGSASMSPDARWIAFSSVSSTFAGEPTFTFDSDIFLRDRVAGTTQLLSTNDVGVMGSGWSSYPLVSFGGNRITFKSEAPNLIPGDHNAQDDIFVRDLTLSVTPVSTYCQPKTNSSACVPRISYLGAPSASGQSQFFLTANHELYNKSGIFFWSTSPASIPFAGGTLCIKAPLVRTDVQFSGGFPQNGACGGSYSFHFSPAYMAEEGVVAGNTLYGQFWGRDPGFQPPNNISLSDGLSFTVGP